MASIYKRKTDRRDAGKPWYIAYADEHGKRCVVKGCTDYRATQEIARQLEADAARRKRGVIDATDERIAEESRRPVDEQVDAFMQYVRSRKRDGHAGRYLQQVKARLDAFTAFCKVACLRDISPDSAAAFIDHLKSRKLSGVTLNEYVGTLKDFTTWATATHRLAKDPLAGIHREDPKKIEKTRPRRAFSADDIGALLDATTRRPVVELRTIRHGPRAGKADAKIKPDVLAKAERLGQERRLAYLLGAWTGLRRGELAALQWCDVRLDILPAKIVLRASTTKAKRGDSIALHPQIIDALRKHRPADAKPIDRVLRTVPGMKVLRADMKRAGINDVNECGRLDLHSLRKSVATYLACHGVPQRLTQAHLRHSDPRLTAGVYTDESLLPVAAAIAELPPLPTEPAQRADVMRLTGTCDEPSSRRAAPLQRASHVSMHSGAQSFNSTSPQTSKTSVAEDVEDSRVSNDVHHDSQQRVMGLEPTTFTLAT